MAKKILTDLNLNQNELQNGVFQNLATAPQNPKDGQVYFNTADNTLYVYADGEWVDALNQGIVYQEGTGIDISGSTISVDTTVIAQQSDIPTDYVPETRKINNKALSSDINLVASDVSAVPVTRKVNDKELSADITLSASDVGALPDSTFIPTVTDTYSSSSSDSMSGKAVASALNDYVPDTRKVNGKALSADITLSASDVGALPSDTVIPDVYNAALTIQKNGVEVATFTANSNEAKTANILVPTTVAELSDASNYALKSDVASAIIPKGSISAVSALPTLEEASLGWMYNFDKAFTTTADFVEGSGKKYPAGTNVVVVEYADGVYKYDIFSGFVDTDAYDSHIADTTIHVTAADKSEWSGKQDAITASNKLDADLVDDSSATNKFVTASEKVQISTNASDISSINSTLSGYGNIVTHNVSEFATAAQGTKADTALQEVTSQDVTDALGYTPAKKVTATNPALTVSSGVCTWTITNEIGSADVQVVVKEVSSNEEVGVGIQTTAANVIITMNSDANISADTYKAIIIG